MLEYERLAQEYAERWGVNDRKPDDDTTEIEAAYCSGFIQARTMMVDWVEAYMRCVPENAWLLTNIREKFQEMGADRWAERARGSIISR